MAEVKMDLSEFQAMQQIESDLRIKVDEIKKLSEENKDLTKKLNDTELKAKQDIIDALEASQMSVTTIYKEDIHEHVIQNRPDHMIEEYIGLRVVEFLSKMINGHRGNGHWNETSIRYLGQELSHRSHHDLKRIALQLRSHNRELGIDAETIRGIFFEKSVSRSRCQTGGKTVSYKGLDEVRAEIAIEEKVKAESNVTYELEQSKVNADRVKELEEKFIQFKKDKALDEATINDLNKVIEEQTEDIKRLSDENIAIKRDIDSRNTFLKRMAILNERTQEILSGDIGFGNRTKVIDKLKKLWLNRDHS